jgi:hypothetical protein
VRDLHRHAGNAADVDDFVNRLKEPTIFAANMADVTGTGIRGELRQRQHLGRVRLDSRVVLEPGRQTDRAARQFLAQQLLHAGNFFGGRVSAEILAHDLIAQGVVPGVGGDVDSSRRCVEGSVEIRKRVMGIAVRADHHGRYSLAYSGTCIAILQNVVIGMAVRIDETRRQHHAAAGNDRLASLGLQFPDGFDTLIANSQISGKPGRARSIDNDDVLNQQAFCRLCFDIASLAAA